MEDPTGKRQKLSGQFVLNLAVPAASAQCYITPDLIKEISQYYSAQVQVAPQDFTLLGEPVRRVVVTSSSIDCNTLAQQRVSQIIDHYDKGGRTMTNALTLKVLVENRYAGLIIGKGGSTIRELQSQSLGAKIQLARKEEMPPDMMESERAVTLLGSLEQVTKAQDLMTKKLEAFKELQASNRFVPQPRPPSTFARPPMHQHQHHQQPMYQNQQFRGQMQHQPQAPSIPSFPPQQHHQPHQQHHQPHHHQQQHHQPSPNPMHMHHHAASYDEYATQPGKLTLVIPAVHMGIVVGKGGSNLKAAIEQCQNSVRIQQEKQENVTASRMINQSMRSINVTGPIAMIHKAAGLLLARIQTHITNKRCSEWTSIFYPSINPDAPPVNAAPPQHSAPQFFQRGFQPPPDQRHFRGPPPSHQPNRRDDFSQKPPGTQPPPIEQRQQPSPPGPPGSTGERPPPPPLEGAIQPPGETKEVAANGTQEAAVADTAADEDEEVGARGIKRKHSGFEETDAVEEQPKKVEAKEEAVEVVEKDDMAVEEQKEEEEEEENKGEGEDEDVAESEGDNKLTEAEIEKMTKAQLKNELEERGLDANGLKAALVKRLKDALQA